MHWQILIYLDHGDKAILLSNYDEVFSEDAKRVDLIW